MEVCDIGSHFNRITQSFEEVIVVVNDVETVVKKRLAERVYMNLPSINMNDVMRHANWNIMAQLNPMKITTRDERTGLDVTTTKPVYVWDPHPDWRGSCACRMDDKGFCEHMEAQIPHCEVITSIDSAYYPGVLECIFAQLTKIRKRGGHGRAYIAF